MGLTGHHAMSQVRYIYTTVGTLNCEGGHKSKSEWLSKIIIAWRKYKPPVAIESETYSNGRGTVSRNVSAGDK